MGASLHKDMTADLARDNLFCECCTPARAPRGEMLPHVSFMKSKQQGYIIASFLISKTRIRAVVIFCSTLEMSVESNRFRMDGSADRWSSAGEQLVVESLPV